MRSAMNPTPHEETLFQAALPLDAAERAAFLNRECAGDPALRARFEALLAAHDQPDTLFGTQAGPARPIISLDLARDLADDLVGQTIGRYKLIEKIGEGGCGVVYVAEQTEPVRRRVALKIIRLTDATVYTRSRSCPRCASQTARPARPPSRRMESNC